MNNLSNYAIGNRIGSGKFGKIYRCREKITKKIFAIKLLSKEQLNKSGIDIHNEYNIHKQCCKDCINIIKMHEMFEDESWIYLLMDYVNGKNLYEYYNENPLSEDLVRRFARQILIAIKHLHDRGIMHRDIKPENIIIDDHTNNAYLIDFGWATNASYSTKICGTLDYLCPQITSNIITAKEDNDSIQMYGPECDLWSYGIIIYEMLFCKPPFTTQTYVDTYKRIMSIDLKFPEETPVSKEAIDLINCLLKYSESDRIRCENALQHPFLKNVE